MLLVLRTAIKDWSDELPVVAYGILIVATIATLLNAVFYLIFMQNTRIIPKKLIPKLSVEKWKGVGLGFGFEKRGTGVLLVLPLIVLELSW